jgi:hypothetical protein
MRVGARAESQGSPAAGAAGSDETVGAADDTGRLLGRLSVLPSLVVMAWLLAGLPLLLAGQFRPAFMFALAVPIAVVLVVLGLRWTPAWSSRAFAVRTTGHAQTPGWAVMGVLAVAVVFGIDQLFYHSQFVIVTRDPASYIQFGYWIAHHGSLPIPQDAAAFGGTYHGALTFSSFAFYQVGNSVVPQFMAGLPMVLAPAIWVGGLNAAAAVSPLLGATAVVVFGGLVARLVGPRWAPLGALVLALSLPEQFTSRSDYSEPLTQILFLGGLCLVIDALNSDGVAARVIAGLAGLALGLTLLVRIDGASDIVPLLPYCGLLLLGRRRQALPLLGGLIVGAIYGGVDGWVLSRPYVDSIGSSLHLLAVAAGAVLVVTVAVVVWRWQRGIPAVRTAWLPNAAAALAVVVAVGFAIRPYFQTVRSAANASANAVVAGFQRADHLPVDPTRLYYEFSLDWVFWYIGVPAVAAATLGAALLARRCVRGDAWIWILPLVTFAWTIVTTLYDPAITPDQPWASRRLVPAVLPGFVLLAIWALSWITGWLRGIDVDRVVRVGVEVCCVAALLLPATITTFGLRLAHGGPVGVKLAADGTGLDTTYRGEITAVDHLCANIPANSSVVILDGPTADRFTEVIRGVCGVPAARMNPPSRALMAQIVRGIAAAGHRPVLMGSAPSQLARYGGPSRLAMSLRTTTDASTLVTPPETTWAFTWYIWVSEPPT